MIYGLYLSANGMITQGMSADAVANNLANSKTHGFKRDFLALRQRDPEVIRQGGPFSTMQKHLLAIGGAVEGDRSHSIFAQGALEPTGNPLDGALNGSGFFKVMDPNGKVYYTRNGAFTQDQQGYLVAYNGFQVLSSEGGPIQYEPGQEGRFDQEGRMLANGEEVATLAMVLPENPDALHKVGENLFELQEEVGELPATGDFKPGFLESSAVSSVREMAAMIEAQRAYEANARFIRLQDETLGKAVTQIASTR